MKNLATVLVIGGAYVVMSPAGIASAIISDGFMGQSNGTTVIGTAPDVTASGGVYLQQSGGGYGEAKTLTGLGAPSPALEFNGQGNAALDLASSGGYVKPTTLTVSADIRLGDIGGTSDQERGLYLGFYSELVGGSPTSQKYTNNKFTGFAMDGAGTLTLFQDRLSSGYDPSGSNVTIVGSVAYGGTFSTTEFYTVSFSVSTLAGAVSNISVEGSSADYSSLEGGTLFTDAVTRYLGLAASSSTALETYGQMDNVIVIPEPTAIGLGAFGMLAMVGRLRRKRRL